MSPDDVPPKMREVIVHLGRPTSAEIEQLQHQLERARCGAEASEAYLSEALAVRSMHAALTTYERGEQSLARIITR